MSLSDYFKLGTVAKLHGYKGELQVKLESEFSLDYKKLESVYVEIHQKPVPFFIDHLSVNGDRLVLALEDIDSETEARKLLQKDLYLPLQLLPDDHESDAAYLIRHTQGFKVKDKELGLLGEVTDVLEYPGQLLLVMKYESKEVLIPFSPEIVTKIDKRSQTVHTLLPDGLLDL